MHDSVDGLTLIFFLGEEFIQCWEVEYVQFVVLNSGIEVLGRNNFLDNLGDSVEDIVEAIGHIVDDDDPGFCFEEDFNDGMGADEPQSPRHE